MIWYHEYYDLEHPLFFPPRQHIFMHSAHTTFVGTPLPQHLLLSGQTWWGSHTWRAPSGNTINDIHDPPQAQQSEVKGGCQPDFRPGFPKLGPDLTGGTPYTIKLHVFLRPWVGSMNIIKRKTLKSMNLIKIKNRPQHVKGGGGGGGAAAPFLIPPPCFYV